MSIRTPVRLLAALTVLAGIPLVSAMAQTQSPTPSDPATPPAAIRPETAPLPPSNPAQKPAMPTRPTDRSVTAPATANPLVGLTVFTSDGSKLSTVQGVVTGSDGKVSAITIKSGGFLGFGGKLVAIPEGKFARTGDMIRLGLTAEEVSKLPEAKDQS